MNKPANVFRSVLSNVHFCIPANESAGRWSHESFEVLPLNCWVKSCPLSNTFTQSVKADKLLKTQEIERRQSLSIHSGL